MENIIVIVGSIGIAVIAIYLIGYFKYKKIDLPGWLKNVESTVGEVKDVTEIIKSNTAGKIQKAASVGELIQNEASKVVDGVYKKVLSGDLDTAKGKKKTAIEAIEGFLKSQKIEVSPELDNYIDLIVSGAVKKSETSDEINKAIDEKISAISKEKDLLQQKVNDLVSKNTALQNKIDAIQATAKTIETTVALETPAVSTEATKTN